MIDVTENSEELLQISIEALEKMTEEETLEDSDQIDKTEVLEESTEIIAMMTVKATEVESQEIRMAKAEYPEHQERLLKKIENKIHKKKEEH